MLGCVDNSLPWRHALASKVFYLDHEDDRVAVVASAIAFLVFKLIFDDRRILEKTTYLKAHIDPVFNGLIA
ncbi:hypothetical protein [Rhizobium jaguaris]|uniref:hypothetical protein n=1 Tax=Rhizobium jaguaris TaxID=1312183 RepID=UPI0013C45963|nr:hypothetical protein [Rhizobium jaguaris]